MKWLLDIKYAFRMLLKKFSFTLFSVSVMAAGLGLCIFMLAFISSIMTRPLPFPQGEQMYTVDSLFNGNKHGGGAINILDYQVLKNESTSFEEIGTYSMRTASLSNGDRAQRFSGIYTSVNIFDFTKTYPILGRIFTEDDTRIGAEPVAIISYKVWSDYFIKDTSVVGQTVQINGVTTEIVGIMPEGFEFPIAGEIWLPQIINTSIVERKKSETLALFVKKKADVPLAEAEQDLKSIMANLEQTYPETNSNKSVYINSFQAALIGDGASMITGLILVAVLFILLLSCVNVGNLLLARANERAKETAIRVALGAPQIRLIMQMMWESTFISLLGGGIGLILAVLGLNLLENILPQMLPMDPPYWWVMELDSKLLLQSIVIMFITIVLTGIVPAWKMTRSNLNIVLRDSTRGAVSKRAGKLNQFLVTFEIALSCILLSISGVLYVVLQEANEVEYGANIENKLTARVALPEASYQSYSDRLAYFQRLTQKLNALPGVNYSGAMSTLPGQRTAQKSLTVEDLEVINNQYPSAGEVVSFSGSMKALNMQLVEGRYFDSRDNKDSMQVAIVTESMADLLWPNQSAIGKRYKFNNDSEWVSVVGVVRHVIHGQPLARSKYRPTTYRPYEQKFNNSMSIFIDVNGDITKYSKAFLESAGSIDPQVPAYNIISLQVMIDKSIGSLIFVRDLFAVFAVCALIIASSGIYGVLANSTTRRTQEIGIRRALGANDAQVLSLLMKQGWFQLVIGLSIGLPVGYLGSQGIVSIVGPDTNEYYITFFVIPVLIGFVVSIATYIPAKKAIKSDPSAALRYE